MNIHGRKALIFILIWVILIAPLNPVLVSAAAGQSTGSLKPRLAPPKPTHTVLAEGESQEIIEVKFTEGAMIRLRTAGLTTFGQDDLSGLEQVFNQHPIREISRLFSQPEDEITAEKAQGEAESGEELADLNLYYRVAVDHGTNPEALIDALNALPIVEIAYPAPLPAPPPGDIGIGHRLDEISALLVTPNFTSQQGYLNAAPGGINAKYAWGKPGGKGNNVKIIDIEYDFNKNHEDLTKTTSAHVGGDLYTAYGDNHGTAVLGEVSADNNSFGVTGISYRSAIRFISPCFGASCASYNPANAINIAKTKTVKGDVILIEQQTTVCNLASGKYGPVEWYQSIFDAIKVATASGRNVVEAAGNGSVNLDRFSCNNKFNRSTRDSGAIIVGAGAPPSGNYGPDRSRLSLSSYGSRVDLQGWGVEVATTGYGDLQGGSNKNKHYTNTFNGTSSASPIVTGAVALFSSIAQETGNYKTPKQIRNILVQTGSSQMDAPTRPKTQHIGPRPNLKKAIRKLIPTKMVLVDGSHNNYFKISTGYAKWKRLLRQNGYMVQELKGPLTASKLKSYNVFVALLPQVNYTSTEIYALKNWTKNGGALLIIGDWGTKNAWSKPAPALSAKFGIYFYKIFGDRCVVDPTNFEPPLKSWIYLYKRNFSSYKQIMSTVNRAQIFCSSSLVGASGSSVIFLDNDANPSSKSVVMGRVFTKGRVLVLADSNFWSNPGPSARNINAFDNKVFALRAIKWLATGSAAGLEADFELEELSEETLPVVEGISPLGP